MTDWIIGICNSGGEGVDFLRFYGTKSEAKRELAKIVREYVRCLDKYEIDFVIGSSVKSIEEIWNTLYAVINGDNFHIDFSAMPLEKISKRGCKTES